jgi:hypothetical protein
MEYSSQSSSEEEFDEEQMVTEARGDDDGSNRCEHGHFKGTGCAGFALKICSLLSGTKRNGIRFVLFSHARGKNRTNFLGFVSLQFFSLRFASPAFIFL